MLPNFLILLVAALVPMIIGFIWYNPKVFGNTWMKAANMSQEDVEGGNMPLIFLVSFVFAFLLSLGVYVLVVHQAHVLSILGEGPVYDAFMDDHGHAFRTFKHGVFHGTIDGILIALPILATNALFERKGFKYIAVNGGYWIVTLALMGGVICQWA